MAAKDKPRRGPGRPSNKPPVPITEKYGIVDSPKDGSNVLELAHDNPMVFKSLFTYFKNIKTKELHLRCDDVGITFFTRDRLKNSRIVAQVAGKHVNWYYCGQLKWLALNCDNVEKMFATIDKTFFKIMINQTIDDPNTITFIFKNAELDKDCVYKVGLSMYTPDIELYEAESALSPESLKSKFPIEFTLTAKQFKKTITDAGGINDKITFEKVGDYPFRITYTKESIVYNEIYKSDSKINLRSDIPPDGSLYCTVTIDNIRSLANSMVTDDIKIFCRESEDILFRSAIDSKALVVSTLTKLD